MKPGVAGSDYIRLRQEVKERITNLLAGQFKSGALQGHPLVDPDWADLDMKAEEILSLITVIWGVERDG